MNEGLIPRRYAKALYKFALEKGDDKKVYRLMTTLAQTFAQTPSLQNAVANPFVSNEDKASLLTTAAGAENGDEIFTAFLKLLEENRRIDMAQNIALDYAALYRKENNIHQVTVTSAAPLDAAEEERLRKLIMAHLNGGTMEYASSVNPELIGGFTVNIDNERLDASIANELKQLRLNLISH